MKCIAAGKGRYGVFGDGGGGAQSIENIFSTARLKSLYKLCLNETGPIPRALLSLMDINPNHICFMASSELSIIANIFNKFKLSYWSTAINDFISLRKCDRISKALPIEAYESVSRLTDANKTKVKISKVFGYHKIESPSFFSSYLGEQTQECPEK